VTTPAALELRPHICDRPYAFACDGGPSLARPACRGPLRTGDQILSGAGRPASGVRDARQRPAAGRRLVLAQPPPTRLAEPGLATLPRPAWRDRDRRPLRRAGLRHVRLDRR